MTVRFIGIVHTQNVSEIHRPTGAPVDKRYLATLANAQEHAGFDSVLIAHSSSSVDGQQVAAFVAANTDKLGLILAQRPGFIAPTYQARQLATLDHFSDGRLAINVISGGDDTEQRRDGDWLSHDERYERTDEFLDVVKRTWNATEPFKHEGKHYRIEGQLPTVKPLNGSGVPIYFGGSSDAAIKVAAKHADVYMLWAESLETTAELVNRVRAEAAKHGRDKHIRFSLSSRPILAATEDKAWARAEDILERAKAQLPANTFFINRPRDPQNTGSQRLLRTVSQGRVVDKRLWTGIAELTRAAGNSTALVGTAEQVAESVLEYHKLGIDEFLFRGFDVVEDALLYGRELLPAVRAAVASHEAGQGAADSAVRAA
ncbi:LLM class flavin-dependent oxidoreductase [Derxia gummosa]|uniref:LLM class flavin-dependent oxidoreductase n=1 Tax=Derxia gummosa DSM 723 TaxID=1121388 RepID=A0A8B6X3N9_9BURK|nr:LLM class flavin-dependent oxidoreductase [Derxia gummosa]